MGLRCSGSIADPAFHHCAVLMGPMLLRSDHALQQYDIKHHFRYADNLLFICGRNFTKIRRLLDDLENTCAPFRGLLEETSHVGVDFLDLFIFKDRTTSLSGRIAISPSLKATSLLSTLSIHSAHACTVHEAWMKAYVLRLRRHSTSLAWFRSFKSEVLCRLRASGVDHAIVDFIDESTVCTFYTDPYLLTFARSSRSRDIWIRLPYHPIWHRAVDSAFASLSKQFSHVLSDIVEDARIRPAWQMTMSALGRCLQKF